MWVAGMKVLKPPRRARFPPGDLGLVLSALQEQPHEPMQVASLGVLTLQTTLPDLSHLSS